MSSSVGRAVMRACAPVALAAALALSGCSSSSPAPDSAAAVGASTSGASPAATGPAVGTAVTGADILKTVTEVAKAQKSGRSTIASGSETPVVLDFAYAGEAVDFRMADPAGGGGAMVLVGDTFYVSEDGTSYEAESLSSASAESKAMLSVLQLMASFADPAKVLSAIKPLSGTVTASSVDAVTYEFTDPKEKATVTVTTDAAGLIQQATVDQTDQKATITYSAWGKAKVSAPPADQITKK